MAWRDQRTGNGTFVGDIYAQKASVALSQDPFTSVDVSLPVIPGNTLVADVDACPRFTGTYQTRTFLPLRNNLQVINTVSQTVEASVPLPSPAVQGIDFNYASDGLHGAMMTVGHILFFADISAPTPAPVATFAHTDTPLPDCDPAFVDAGGSLYCIVPYLGSVRVFRLTGSTVTDLYTVARTSVGIEAVDPQTEGTTLFIPNSTTLDFVTLATGAPINSVTLNYPPRRETDLIWDPVGGRAWWPLDGAVLRINPAGFVDNEIPIPGASVEGVDLAIRSVSAYPFRLGAFATTGFVHLFDMLNGSLLGSCPTPGAVVPNFDPLITSHNFTGAADGVVWWSVIDHTYVIDASSPGSLWATLDTPGGLVDGCDLTASNDLSRAILPHPGFVHVINLQTATVGGTVETPGDLLTDVDPIFPVAPFGGAGSRIIQPYSGGVLIIKGFAGLPSECVVTTTTHLHVLNPLSLAIAASYPLPGLTEGIDPVIAQGVASPFDFDPATARDIDQDFICHEEQRYAYVYGPRPCPSVPDPLIVYCDVPTGPWSRVWGLPRLTYVDPYTRTRLTVLSDRQTVAFNGLQGNLLATVTLPRPIVGGIVPNRDRSYCVTYLQDKKAIPIELIPLTLVGAPQTHTIDFPDAINWPPARDPRDGVDLGLTQGGTGLALIDSRHGTLLQTIPLPSPAIYPPIVDYKNQVASVLLRSRQRAIVNLQAIEAGQPVVLTVVSFYSPINCYPVGNTVYDGLNNYALNLDYTPGTAQYGLAVTHSITGDPIWHYTLPAPPYGGIYHEPKSKEVSVPVVGQKVLINLAPLGWGQPPVTAVVGGLPVPWRYDDGRDYYHRWQVGIHGPNTVVVFDDYHQSVVTSLTTTYPVLGPAIVDAQNQYAEIRLDNGYVLFLDLFRLAKGDPGYYRYDYHGSQMTDDPLFDPHGGIELALDYSNVVTLRRPRTGAYLGSVSLADHPVRPMQLDPHNRVLEAIMPNGDVYHVDLSSVNGTSVVSLTPQLVNTGGAALAATDVTSPIQPNTAGISVSPIGADGVSRIQAPPGSVEPRAYVALINRTNRSIEPVESQADSAGGFDAYAVVITGDTLCIVTADVAGNFGPAACIPITATQADVEQVPGPITILRPPSPNPVWAVASIEFSLERAGPVTLEIHDVSGRLVRTLVHERLAAGWHTIRWDGSSRGAQRVHAGVYYVRLVTEQRTLVQPLVRLGVAR